MGGSYISLSPTWHSYEHVGKSEDLASSFQSEYFYTTNRKILSGLKIRFLKNLTHAQYFLRVSWLAFTEMPMWPLSPRSGLPLISVMAPFLWCIIAVSLLSGKRDTNQMIITERIQRSSGWATTFTGTGHFPPILPYDPLAIIANLFIQPRDGMNLVAKEFVACRSFSTTSTSLLT